MKEDNQAVIDKKVSDYIGKQIEWLKDEKHKDNARNQIHSINAYMMLLSGTGIVSPECYDLLQSDFDSAKESANKRSLLFDSPN